MQFEDDTHLADLIRRAATKRHDALGPFPQQQHIGAVVMVQRNRQGQQSQRQLYADQQQDENIHTAAGGANTGIGQATANQDDDAF